MLEITRSILCRRCGRRVDGTATWCPDCGKPLRRFEGPSLMLLIVGAVALAGCLVVIAWKLMM
ncbi:MAG TPA: hypothetical protein VH370_03495 [Humisphaera sp.]|jgi:hypothetical protein|nr:hypothetical protein [Humisphaera sp.]